MAFNSLFFTVPAAIIPSLLLLFYFYKNDRHPEPVKELLMTFAWGVVGTIVVLFMARPALGLLYNISNPYLQGSLHALLLAAIPEETIKMFVIVGYSMKTAEFDEPMDGLVYGVTASLGFATLENILYVSQGGMYTALVRAFTAVPTHAALGVIMGYFLSRFYFGNDRRSLAYAWGIPVLLHAAYDFPLMTARTLFRNNNQTYGITQIVLIIAAAIIIRIILGYALRLYRKVSRNQKNEADDEENNIVVDEIKQNWSGESESPEGE